MSEWNLEEWYPRLHTYLSWLFDNVQNDDSQRYLDYCMAEVVNENVLYLSKENLCSESPSRNSICCSIFESLLEKLCGSQDYGSDIMLSVLNEEPNYIETMKKYNLPVIRYEEVGTFWKRKCIEDKEGKLMPELIAYGVWLKPYVTKYVYEWLNSDYQYFARMQSGMTYDFTMPDYQLMREIEREYYNLRRGPLSLVTGICYELLHAEEVECQEAVFLSFFKEGKSIEDAFCFSKNILHSSKKNTVSAQSGVWELLSICNLMNEKGKELPELLR